MQRTLALVVAFHGLAGALRAQGEAALRSHFEGRTVAEFVEGVLVRFTIMSR